MNKMAEVIGFFENGTAKVKFDGEETPSEKEYGFLRHYIPKIGDRVFMMDFNGSYIIFDAVDYQVPAQKPLNQNYIKGNTVIEGNLILKGEKAVIESANGEFKTCKAENIDDKLKKLDSAIDGIKKDIKTNTDRINEARNIANNAQRTAENLKWRVSNLERKVR
jgi:hypothetical protein